MPIQPCGRSKRLRVSLAVVVVALLALTAHAQLIVTPSSSSIEVGQTVQLTTPGVSGAKWTSSQPNIASVNSVGLVTGLSPGTATLTAKKGNQSGSAVVTVLPALPPPPPPPGTTYYVRVDGDDTHTGLTNSTSEAWATINYAATHVVAGDTVRVQAGTYAEVASPSVSGTSGNTVTLVADGAVTTCGMTFSSKSYIRVIGFTMDRSTGGCANTINLQVTGINTGLEFWNNTFDHTTANQSVVLGDASDRCNSCIIIGGSIHNVDNGFTALVLTGDDIFAGYIDFASICYLGVGPAGNRLRMVNLNFSEMVQCGGTHPDFIYAQGLNTLGYSNNLVESSYGIGTPTATDNKAMHIQPQTTPTVDWSDDIWRFNLTDNMGAGFYSLYTSANAPGGGINRFRFYNNTHVDCDMAQLQTDASYSNCGNLSQQNGGKFSASIFNNIFVRAWTNAARTSGAGGWVDNLGTPVITAGYNLGYDSRGAVTFAGDWTTQPGKQDNVNPWFVSDGSDFRLQSASGARSVGGPLTTAVSCAGTTLNVATGTGSFFLGDNASRLPQYGGALVPGDVLTIGASTTRAVVSVSGDAITVNALLTCAPGDGVFFGTSSSVDIGAYPYKAGGYALSASVAITGGTATITPNDASLVRFVVCYSDHVPYAVVNASPYTCATQAGTFSARVYPRYASTTLYTTATGG